MTAMRGRSARCGERVAQARRACSARDRRAPSDAALAARSTGSTSPSSSPVAGVAIPVARAEAAAADRLRQAADAGEAVVVEQDDRRSSIPSCDGGDDLLRHHQVRAVADEDVDVALRRGHLHAEPAGDLVAHARVAVSDVIALRDRARATACAGRPAGCRRRRRSTSVGARVSCSTPITCACAMRIARIADCR